ncbi:nucleotidyltransferase family protein [Citricoccus sp. I39-566]|uniref:nucleotidyltransferase family protein n=1 Tax=Citricoccus sp. I39-566 TaxID=3073268 RepID=UPI00286A9305|nr:nucleotidyltransferase family protein [Citricoccus sp. I39-566]WMY76891.1 nucleotidyltransferase family protein [Citricoccus sp. I39-566]
MSPEPPRPVVGVLLAAGAGRRLGRGPKALLRLDHGQGGEPLVVRAATALRRGGCDEVVVVVGASGRIVRDALEAAGTGTPEPGRCRVVANPDWESGLGSSFRAGIDAAGRLLSAPGGGGDGSIMLALVDQPGLGEAVVARLLDAAAQEVTGRRVTAAGYPDARGRLVRGHPLVFPLALARQAAALAEGDAAGRLWLRAHPEAVDVVDVGDLATGRDLDTPADLLWWTRREAVEGSRGVRT